MNGLIEPLIRPYYQLKMQSSARALVTTTGAIALLFMSLPALAQNQAPPGSYIQSTNQNQDAGQADQQYSASQMQPAQAQPQPYQAQPQPFQAPQFQQPAYQGQPYQQPIYQPQFQAQPQPQAMNGQYQQPFYTQNQQPQTQQPPAQPYQMQPMTGAVQQDQTQSDDGQLKDWSKELDQVSSQQPDQPKASSKLSAVGSAVGTVGSALLKTAGMYAASRAMSGTYNPMMGGYGYNGMMGSPYSNSYPSGMFGGSPFGYGSPYGYPGTSNGLGSLLNQGIYRMLNH